MSIAEDMVDGDCCSWCGVFFELNGDAYRHGSPLVCQDCFKQYRKEDRCGKQSAIRKLFRMGLDVFAPGKKTM